MAEIRVVMSVWVVSRHNGPIKSCLLCPDSGHSSVQVDVRKVPKADLWVHDNLVVLSALLSCDRNGLHLHNGRRISICR